MVREEADEVVFWLEFASLSGLVTKPRVAEVLSEARELKAIVSAAYRTSKARLTEKKPDSVAEGPEINKS